MITLQSIIESVEEYLEDTFNFDEEDVSFEE